MLGPRPTACGVHVAATPRWPLLSVLPSLTSGPLQYHGRECVPWGIGRCPIGQPAIPALAPCRLAGNLWEETKGCPMSSLKRRVRRRLDAEAGSLVELSHRVHQNPEVAYQEVASSTLVADALELGGLRVQRHAYGVETAFRATAGSSGPEVVICAEYDALPEIGHACGHNIIAASSAGAGLALSEIAEDLGIRVTVLGTPA